MLNANDAHFESKKNTQAGTITLGILAALFLFLFLIGWTTPAVLQPVPEEGMEVNLGNSDAGLGNDQPFEPGKPAPQDQQQYTPPKAVAETQKEDVRDPLSDDKDEAAPEIKKPPVVKPDATKIADKAEPKKVMPKAAEPTPPAPKPPTAKAVFKGVNGTGTGGNDADSYKKGGSEGIAGGKGDQGRPGGDPNSKNYTGGGHGNSGAVISRGLEGRSIVRVYNYQGDFDTNEKVAVDVKIDQNGNVVSASYQPRGSTTSSSSYKDKALEIVRKSKFNTSAGGPDEQTGTVLINFRINN